ncbi:LOS1 [[Candida] subhashii]|uniref:Exportin-T n=1 Tax=[Candida] subhashii TaxID=561895 RepID=A0A8J5UMW6_9ASCO|nr:LOS1 [[Candida] subhashii]KAG7663317.1 LOS1 [[Candida] subhashii]
MEQQIHQAVEIALSGNADVNLKNQAYDFINQIKSTEAGYKSCLEILIKSTSQPVNEGLKFFVYQVIDENIDKLNQEQLFSLNSQIFKVLEQYIANNIKDATHSRNKFAQIFAKTFCHVYINIYPKFIKDLFSMISTNNQLALDYYSRIILSIHSEIGDKFISRSREGQERNNLLKDAIRLNDMESLVINWFKILSNQNNSTEILENTLKIVGAYISWMEIGLFVSAEYINIILTYLNRTDERNVTCETIMEIISKKMPPINKLELITLFNFTTVITSIGLSDDIDFMEHIAKLLNAVGTELLIVIENQPDLVNQVKAELFRLWPLVFTFLSHEYDDVSQQVFPFIQHYLLTCKKNPILNDIELMSTLLNKVILKMKYDDDDSGLDDDEHEQFMEIRSKLKTFQDTIAVLNPDLYVTAIPIVINESIFNGGGKDNDWRKLELGLYELSNFSESLRNNLINVPKDSIGESKPYAIFQEYLIKLINSDFITKVNHPKIQLVFFEIIVKHYNFLNQQANRMDLIIRILEIFTSPLGLFNEIEKVRLRSWYLFFRFMKLTKPRITNESLVEEMIVKLQPLLVIKAELPTRDEDDDVVENGNFNNQQYLFETIGLLISLLSDQSSAPVKSKLLDIIFQPLFNDLENCISIPEQQRENQPVIALQAHHSLMAIGTVVRGYDYEFNMKYPPQIIEKVNQAARVVLITLENFPKHEIIRDAARFSFARFIPILKNTISVHLAELITLIWSAPNLQLSELSDFLGFLGQITHNYKSDENIYQLLNNFLSSLFHKIFEVLDTKTREEELMPEIIRDKNLLKKAILNFLSSMVLNNCASLLVTETNKAEFPEIIGKLFEYSYDLSETSVSKLAINQLINIVNVFGNGGKITDPKDKYSAALPPVEGIDEFLMNKVVHLSFELPFQKQEFDVNDAQFRLIAQEIAILLKSYQLKKGDVFVNYLSTYLMDMGLSQDLMNDFCIQLNKNDTKDFKKYFITFVTRLKGGK